MKKTASELRLTRLQANLAKQKDPARRDVIQSEIDKESMTRGERAAQNKAKRSIAGTQAAGMDETPTIGGKSKAPPLPDAIAKPTGATYGFSRRDGSGSVQGSPAPESSPVSADGLADSLQGQPQASLLRRIELLEQKIASLTGQRRSPVYAVRKGATASQFTEITIPASGTTLTPMVSGGRAATSDSDPVVPLDLGIDDSILLEVPSPGKMRTIRITGAAVRKVRYIQTPVHAFQQTFKANPLVDADWETITTLDSCTPAARATRGTSTPKTALDPFPISIAAGESEGGGDAPLIVYSRARVTGRWRGVR